MKKTVSLIFLIGITVMLGLTLFSWAKIPPDSLIATHWGIDGEANGFSTKTFGLLIMPIVSIVLLLIFTLIPKIEPRQDNLALRGSFILWSIRWL